MLHHATQPVKEAGSAGSKGRVHGTGNKDPWTQTQVPRPDPPLSSSHEWHTLPHAESPVCSSQATSARIHQSPVCLLTSKLRLPLKDLCHLVLVEDEAGMIVSQDSHDAQAQAGSVAAHQVRGFEKQLGFDDTQFIQELAE